MKYHRQGTTPAVTAQRHLHGTLDHGANAGHMAAILRLFISRTLVACMLASAALAADPGPVPQAVRARFRLAPFYQKHLDAGGLPVVGSARVSDAALAECAWIVRQMLAKRPDILEALGKAGVRFAVMAHDEYTTDIPEHAKLTPRVFWDRRARGLGATPSALAVSAAEENLLSFPGDPYPREIIAIHEFAHAIHEMAMNTLDPTFDGRLKLAYEKAIGAGLWKGTYAAVNRQEYWAEAVQAWFDNNAANDALHNDTNTRVKLRAYDAGVAALCEEVFGDVPWRYAKPADRAPADRAHLAGIAANPPRFHWRDEAVPERPRVIFQCAAGDLELEFDASAAREPVARLLAQVQGGFFSGGKATVSVDAITLAPAAKTPDGVPVPEGTAPWRIILRGDAPPDAVRASIIKGGTLVPKLIEQSAAGAAVPVQRIVRLN